MDRKWQVVDARPKDYLIERHVTRKRSANRVLAFCNGG